MGLSSLRHCNLFGESKGPSYIFYRHISIRMDVVLKLGPEVGGVRGAGWRGGTRSGSPRGLPGARRPPRLIGVLFFRCKT